MPGGSAERIGLVATQLAWCVSACAPTDAPTEAPRSERFDSAGIAIIASAAPSPDSRLPWTVGTSPTLVIGALDGDPEYELYEVAHAIRVGERVLVSNSGSSEIRVYGVDGVHVESWGREGEGPGEFTDLGHLMRWPGDSIVAWDEGLNRVTLFDAAGRVGRTLRLAVGDDPSPAVAEATFSDGSFLAGTRTPIGSAPRETGLARLYKRYAHLGPEGELLADYGEHLGQELYLRVDRMAVMSHPFRRTTVSAVWGGRALIANNERYVLRAYQRAGPLEAIVRRESETVLVTRADMDAWVQRRLEAAEPGSRATLAELSEGFPLVENYPVFTGVLVDALGWLWVQEYTLPDDPTSIWTIFDPEGRAQGLVEAPAGVTLYEIGVDYLLGSFSDELDVETVQLWSLMRPRP